MSALRRRCAETRRVSVRGMGILTNKTHHNHGVFYGVSQVYTKGDDSNPVVVVRFETDPTVCA